MVLFYYSYLIVNAVIRKDSGNGHIRISKWSDVCLDGYSYQLTFCGINDADKIHSTPPKSA